MKSDKSFRRSLTMMTNDVRWFSYKFEGKYIVRTRVLESGMFSAEDLDDTTLFIVCLIKLNLCDWLTND